MTRILNITDPQDSAMYSNSGNYIKDTLRLQYAYNWDIIKETSEQSIFFLCYNGCTDIWTYELMHATSKPPPLDEASGSQGQYIIEHNWDIILHF